MKKCQTGFMNNESAAYDTLTAIYWSHNCNQLLSLKIPLEGHIVSGVLTG